MREHVREVEQLAALDAEIAAGLRRKDEAEQAVAKAVQAALAVRERWTGAWSSCGIAPQTPTAMLAWLRRKDDVVQQVRNLRELRIELKTLEEAEAAHAAGLARLLAAQGAAAAGSAADLLVAADSVLARAAQAHESRRALW